MGTERILGSLERGNIAFVRNSMAAPVRWKESITPCVIVVVRWFAERVPVVGNQTGWSVGFLAPWWRIIATGKQEQNVVLKLLGNNGRETITLDLASRSRSSHESVTFRRTRTE